MDLFTLRQGFFIFVRIRRGKLEFAGGLSGDRKGRPYGNPSVLL